MYALDGSGPVYSYLLIIILTFYWEFIERVVLESSSPELPQLDDGVALELLIRYHFTLQPILTVARLRTEAFRMVVHKMRME